MVLPLESSIFFSSNSFVKFCKHEYLKLRFYQTSSDTHFCEVVALCAASTIYIDRRAPRAKRCPQGLNDERHFESTLLLRPHSSRCNFAPHSRCAGERWKKYCRWQARQWWGGGGVGRGSSLCLCWAFHSKFSVDEHSAPETMYVKDRVRKRGSERKPY